MVIEIIRALVLGGVPVAAFTFLVLQWSVVSGRLAPFSDEKALDEQYKEQRKAKKAEKQAEKKAAKEALERGEEPPKKQKDTRPWLDKSRGEEFLHNKAMFFGGGYYGTMALFAYAVIEMDEIFEFLGVVFTPGAWFEYLTFQLIIGFFINTIMNIVGAFTWFITLQNYVSMGNGWIWLGASYVGYLAGVRLVAKSGDEIWAWLNDRRIEGVEKVTDFVKKQNEKS